MKRREVKIGWNKLRDLSITLNNARLERHLANGLDIIIDKLEELNDDTATLFLCADHYYNDPLKFIKCIGTKGKKID